MFFSCSLRLGNCQGQHLPEAAWCDYYRAEIHKITCPSGFCWMIEKKEQVEKATLGESNIFFEEGQFTEQEVC